MDYSKNLIDAKFKEREQSGSVTGTQTRPFIAFLMDGTEDREDIAYHVNALVFAVSVGFCKFASFCETENVLKIDFIVCNIFRKKSHLQKHCKNMFFNTKNDEPFVFKLNCRVLKRRLRV
jgi:hypothetical protein